MLTSHRTQAEKPDAAFHRDGTIDEMYGRLEKSQMLAFRGQGYPAVRKDL